MLFVGTREVLSSETDTVAICPKRDGYRNKVVEVSAKEEFIIIQ